MLNIISGQGTANPNKNKIPFYKLSKTKKFVIPLIIKKADK